MAGIDKTYTSSYKEYKDFKDWVDTQFLTFYNGHTVRIGDWVYERDEEEFYDGILRVGEKFYYDYERYEIKSLDDYKKIAIIFNINNPDIVKEFDFDALIKLIKKDKELPIMNTPTWLDVYLIQNCKSEFVLNRMKEVYKDKTYQEFKTIDLTAAPPDDFKRNRKIRIKKTESTRFPIHNKPYDGKTSWWIQSNDNFTYCEETGVWSSYNNYYPYNTNTSIIKSMKGIVRHLRKQYLPKGISFRIIGRYQGEEYIASIH